MASVQVDTGAVRGIYGGQDYLESQINWAVAGGMGGSTLKPFALTAGIKEGFSLKDTFDGNSPFELPDGTGEVENQGDHELRLGGQPDQGHRGLRSTPRSSTSPPEHGRRARGDRQAGEPDGRAVRQGAAQGRTASPTRHRGLRPVTGVALGSGTVSPINMANGYATIANDGRGRRAVHHRRGRQQDGETLYEHR